MKLFCDSMKKAEGALAKLLAHLVMQGGRGVECGNLVCVCAKSSKIKVPWKQSPLGSAEDCAKDKTVTVIHNKNIYSLCKPPVVTRKILDFIGFFLKPEIIPPDLSTLQDQTSSVSRYNTSTVSKTEAWLHSFPTCISVTSTPQIICTHDIGDFWIQADRYV